MLGVHTGTRLAAGVAVPDRVLAEDREPVRVTVDVRVPVAVFVLLLVATGVAVKDRDTVGDGVRDPLTEAELDALEEPLGEPEAEEDADGVIVAVPTVCVGVPVTDNEGVPLCWARAVWAKQMRTAKKGDTARKVRSGRAWVGTCNDIFIINVCDAPVCGAGRGCSAT